MSLVLEGTVKEIGDLIEKGTFSKKEILLTIDESSQWPQDIPIDVINKSVSILDSVGVGDKISIDINLRGNEYNGRHYPSINGWRLNVVTKGTGIPAQDTVQDAVAADGPIPPEDDSDDGLPF